MGPGQPPQLVEGTWQTVLCDVWSHIPVWETELLDLLTRGRCSIDKHEVDLHGEEAENSPLCLVCCYSFQDDLLNGSHGGFVCYQK